MATKYVVTGDQYREIDRRMREIKRQLDQKSGSPLKPEKVAKVLQNLQTIIEGKKVDKVDNVFPITIDYNRSLAKMIKAGKYGEVNNDIKAKHFPLKGKGKHELNVTLFHFDRCMESEDVVAEMNKQGFRPGLIEELLALGKKYPDLKKELPIVALGSIWQDRRYFNHVAGLYLSAVERKRNLALHLFIRKWDAYYHFLAVRK